VTFTLTSAPTPASAPPTPPTAAFSWEPSAPHVGEPVSLLSTSSDSDSTINAFAWDLADSGTLTAGGPTNNTVFASAGNHIVRLSVSSADGLSSAASETIPVLPAVVALMRPFPIVRIASTDTHSGIRLRILKVQAPGGTHISVTCRGRGCPAKSQKMVAAAASGGLASYTFHKFERGLRAGIVLEVRISSGNQIGKYTRLTVRRGKLPQRVDLCLTPGGSKAITCPS
jgi:PKD repeat protein